MTGTAAPDPRQHLLRQRPSRRPPRRAITGLFADERSRAPDRRVELPPLPASPFRPWNGRDVVLYDRATITEVNLGEGAFASFSPDGRWLAWMKGDPLSPSRSLPEIWVYDTRAGKSALTAEGLLGWWVSTSTRRLRDRPDASARTRDIDLETGNVVDMGLRDYDQPRLGG